jgi:hypothetical protein
MEAEDDPEAKDERPGGEEEPRPSADSRRTAAIDGARDTRF